MYRFVCNRISPCKSPCWKTHPLLPCIHFAPRLTQGCDSFCPPRTCWATGFGLSPPRVGKAFGHTTWLKTVRILKESLYPTLASSGVIIVLDSRWKKTPSQKLKEASLSLQFMQCTHNSIIQKYLVGPLDNFDHFSPATAGSAETSSAGLGGAK